MEESRGAPAAAPPAPAAQAPPAAPPPAPAAPPPAPTAAAAAGSSSAQAGVGDKRKADWFGAAGDGGSQPSAAAGVSAALRGVEVKAAVSSIKSKLSKPKGSSSTGLPQAREAVRKTAISAEELMRDQAAHEAKLRAQGKAVPHYRKK